MGLSGKQREIVSRLLETKAVDFEAIGSVLAEYGPTMALDMDYEDGFCGTMRRFVGVFRPVFGPEVNLEEIGPAIAGELGG